MRIGFTGTRTGMTVAQVVAVVNRLQLIAALRHEVLIVHHGDCMGADEQFHKLVFSHLPDARIVLHPPTNNALRAFCSGGCTVLTPRGYLLRNKDIVHASDIVLAAPATQHEVLRSGTWATIRYARKYGKECVVFPPLPHRVATQKE